MGDTTSTAWRCLVCGYVHRGSEPPDFCPVCGAGQDEFEPYIEQSPRVESSPCNHWRCINCGYVHEGSDPPEVCPICDVGSDEFESAHELSPEAGAVKIKAVIVGGGVAGVSAAETIRKNSERSQITLIATESELPYYRLNLTR
jgi:nitrite reductase (NADH) large subunit